MTERAVSAGVFVLVVLMASSAFAVGGGWTFNGISTLDPPPSWEWWDPYFNGKIYQADGTTLVEDGALVQIIIGLDGTDIVDPLEYFDTNESGSLEGAEYDDLLDWLWTGADPADISGGTNVLAYGTLGFTGEFATSAGKVDWTAPAGSEPVIANGVAQDKLAWRAWNLTKEDLMKWGNVEEHPEMFGTELWYTDGREYFGHDNAAGGPDTGWWIGMPDLEAGGDVSTWIGFEHLIGAEVYAYYMWDEPTARSQNRLDHYLGTIIPEPASLTLAASALLLLVAGAAKKVSRAEG